MTDVGGGLPNAAVRAVSLNSVAHLSPGGELDRLLPGNRWVSARFAYQKKFARIIHATALPAFDAG